MDKVDKVVNVLHKLQVFDEEDVKAIREIKLPEKLVLMPEQREQQQEQREPMLVN
jgi:hypothetical protein